MRLKRYALLLSAAFACTGSLAASDDVPPEIASKITTTLHERIPELRIQSLHKAPIAGLYEINTGDELIYTNDTGTLIFQGRILDSKSRQDLTAQRWNELNAIDFKSLPFDLAIKAVHGDGSRKLAVFADPLCPYCRMLEQQMQGITNVTVYTFLYPLESIHPGASAKAVAIWCAKDRAAAWSNWMLQKVDPGEGRCKGAPIERLQALGDKLHVNSTPTLFTVDGRRLPGALKHNEIEQLLANSHK